MTTQEYQQQLMKLALSELERIGLKPTAKNLADMCRHLEKMDIVKAALKAVYC